MPAVAKQRKLARKRPPAHGETADGDTQELVDLEGTPIPADYSDWALRAWQPTPVDQLRILLLGFPGTGKTSFVSSIPNALILDPEIAAGDVWNPKAARTKPMNLLEYGDLITKLEQDGLSDRHPFNVIVFDTMDKFLDLTIQHLTKEYNLTHDRQVKAITDIGPTGWHDVRRFLMNWVNRLSQAGYGVVLCAHRKERETQTHSGSIAVIRAPALTPSLLEAVNQTVHMIVGLNKIARAHVIKKEVTNKKTGKTRTRVIRVETRHEYALEFNDPLNLGEDDSYNDEGSTAKSRYAQFLPDDVPVKLGDGWATFADAYNEAVKAAGAVAGQEVA